MKETERQPKVTLEDLLQFKRAERPPAEFWAQFEQELRAKQLAAIVETRPWWHTWTARKTLVRVCVPLGATALVAMTFGSFRVASVKPATSTAGSNIVAVQTPTVVGDSTVAQVSQVRTAVNEFVALSASAAQGDSVDSLPLMVVTQTTESASTNSTEQVLASSSATVKAAGQALAQLVGLGGNSQFGNARTPVVEPLTQVATPRDSRRTRLLAYSVAFDPHAADSSESVRSRERITRRISDEAIYDSITRLGLSGNRVSIKF